MKHIVTISCEMVEAPSHGEAFRKAIEKLRDDGIAHVQVCDMEIGFRQKFDVDLRAALREETT